MFEQSILPTNSKSKPWTLAVSLLAQTSLVLLAALIPLIYTDQLPSLSKWAENLVAPLPRAAPLKPPEQQPSARSNTAQKPFTAPSNIPKTVAALVDDVTQLVPQMTSETIIGSIPGTAVPNALSQMFTNMAFPKPPPQPAPAKAKAADTAPMKVSSGIQEAKLLRRIVPIYPQMAIIARIQGTVHLVGVISKEGTIRELQVIDGSPLLVKAALDAVRQWVYKPTLLSGEPVEVIAPITVTFTLNR
jgi:protein TonB